MQKITPFLWFDGKAGEAIDFYTSVFKNSKVVQVARYGKGAPGGMEGEVMTGTFELDGQQFMALNGGPMFQFTPAISMFVSCEDQAEVDHFWEALSAGGEKSRCGWLKDKFGVSWQVIPKMLGNVLYSNDAAASQRAMAAMMKMGKLVIKDLQDAYDTPNT